jgi:hypothetical protein
MEFSCACIDGESYGDEKNMTKEEISEKPQVSNVDFRDRKLFDVLKNKNEAVM